MTVKDWLGESNKLGIDIWEKKYQQYIPSLKRKETFEEWLDRVSNKNESVKQLIINKKFLFGGRILANRGMNKEGRKITYSNCYVLATDDSLEAIYNSAYQLARTYSYGGGVGIDLSPLRPNNSAVNNAAKSTTGPLSFAEIFEKTTEIIGQEGRRGALMLSMSCEHPDIEDFIKVKEDLNKITHANMSVRMTDRFLRDAEKQRIHTNTFKVNSSAGNFKVEKQIDASALIDTLAKCNWDMGEPGMLFWDTIEHYNLLNNNPNFKYAGTNPCAEEPLPEGGSCLLGSMNLVEFVKDGNFDYDDFSNSVKIATEALNEVLFEGLPLHPLEIQRESVNNWRQIGLGIMGLADCLIKLNEKYGSELSILTSKQIGEVLANSAAQRSAELVDKYGCYPMCADITSSESPINSDFAKNVFTEETLDIIKKHGGLANSQLLTIAPTGTLSTMLGISGGIEPIFANYYERTTKSLHGEDVTYKVYTPIVKEYMDNFELTSAENLPEYFITAREIDPIDRVVMQSVWQQFIDASISSTVNLPENTTVDDIRDIYMEAWKRGLKGITVFRENCKRIAILNTPSANTENNNSDDDEDLMSSTELIGKRKKLQTGCGSLHVLAYFNPKTKRLQEIYLAKGSTGGCNNYMNGLSRTISLLCRSGVDIYTIKDQLDSTGNCPSYSVRTATKKDTSKGSCCPMAVGNALVEMYEEFKKEIFPITINTDTTKKITKQPEISDSDSDEKQICPECGAELRHSGGCDFCPDCGYSHCG